MSNWSKNVTPKFGDVVMDQENQLGVILDISDGKGGLTLGVFLSNGLTVEGPAEEFRPRRSAIGKLFGNFAEVMKPPASKASS